MTGTINITVTNVNAVPTTNDVNMSINEDSGISAVVLSGADTDGSVTHFKLTSLPGNGTLLVNGVAAAAGVDYAAGSSFTFQPNANYNGPVSFQYVAKDNSGAYDATPATVSITVNPVNDAPSAVVDSNAAANTVAENSAVGTVVGITGFATDLEGPVTYSLANNGGGRFQINATTGVVTVAGAIDYETLPAGKTISITIRATDSGGLFSQTTLDIAVTDVAENTNPVGAKDYVLTSSTGDVTITSAWLLRNDTDAETPNSLTITDADTAAGKDSSDFDTVPAVSGGNVTFNLDTDTGHSVYVADGETTGIEYDIKDPSGGVHNNVLIDVTYESGTTLTGTANSELIIGDGDNETLNGGGASVDWLFGQGGNDVLVYGAGDKFDGGADFDYVRLTDGNTSFTYQGVGANAQFNGIELIDLGDGNARNNSQNTVNISAADVLDLGANAHDTGVNLPGGADLRIDLFVVGDNDGASANNRDNVNLSGFTQVGDVSSAGGTQSTFNYDVPGDIGSRTFTVWTDGGGKYIAIEQGLDVTTS